MLNRECDICGLNAESYAKTHMGPYAYLCQECYQLYAASQHVDKSLTTMNK